MTKKNYTAEEIINECKDIYEKHQDNSITLQSIQPEMTDDKIPLPEGGWLVGQPNGTYQVWYDNDDHRSFRLQEYWSRKSLFDRTVYCIGKFVDGLLKYILE